MEARADRAGLAKAWALLWRPFEDWSSSPASADAPYLLDAQTRLVGPSINNVDGLNAEQALAMLRDILAKPNGVVRLVGLSRCYARRHEYSTS